MHSPGPHSRHGRPPVSGPFLCFPSTQGMWVGRLPVTDVTKEDVNLDTLPSTLYGTEDGGGQ